MSAKSRKYDIPELIEAQFQAGSRGRVLKNLLGITSVRKMNICEKDYLIRTADDVAALYGPTHSFSSADICAMHKRWLGSIYVWAGQYRNVMMCKNDFPFASPEHIPALMRQLERGPLQKYTPCSGKTLAYVVEALAVVHTELVLIHPFREGNGRIARILATLMALQVGLPPLDFSSMTGGGKGAYIAAVQAGMVRDYRQMQSIFESVIRTTLAVHGRR